MANTTCLISLDALFDCAAIPIGGIADRIILINYFDWTEATVVVDTGVTEEITSITLDTGIEGFEFQVAQSGSIIPSDVKRSVTGGMDGFDHQLDVTISDTSQVQRENIAKMRFGRIVGIVETLDGKAAVYGQNVGMLLSDFQDLQGDATKGGTLQFILKTTDTQAPETMPVQIIASTFDLDTLLTPAV